MPTAIIEILLLVLVPAQALLVCTRILRPIFNTWSIAG